MSSQHLEEADALADRICIMTKGKILKVGEFHGIGVPEKIKN
jgi:ABC-type multidrug transport system ATPase subunit